MEITKDETETIKIKRAVVKNIKKIKLAEITPESDVIILTGGNRQGKSSFSDAVFMAFGGGDSIPEIPLNRDTGSKEGSVTVELTNGLTLERKVNARGTTLKITDQSGKSITAPQKYVNERLELFSFNPVDFSETSGKNRVMFSKSIIKKVVGSDLSSFQIIIDRTNLISKEAKEGCTSVEVIDLLINSNNGLLYMGRRDTAREIKTLSSVIGENELKDHSEEIEELNVLIIGTSGSGGFTGEEKIVEYEKAHEKAKDVFDATDTLKEAYSNLMNTMPEKLKSKEMIGILSIDQKINDAYNFMKIVVHNQKVGIDDSRKEVEGFKIELVKLQTEQTQYEKNKTQIQQLKYLKTLKISQQKDLDELESIKAKILSEINLPVEGMEVREDDVYINNIPFSQCSQSERMIIAIKLSMALNPKIHVMRILNGSLLDQDTFDELKKLVIEMDFQLWIEWVDNENTGVGYYFEDGEIK